MCQAQSLWLPVAVTFRKKGVDWNKRYVAQQQWCEMSPSVRKVWIEISIWHSPAGIHRSHLPQGRCGLKFNRFLALSTSSESPSARKVWIEISRGEWSADLVVSPSVRKVWIEIIFLWCYIRRIQSPSVRKVWIEIHSKLPKIAAIWSPSVRKVWIEIFVNSVIWYCTSSLSARKMWIEIGEQGKWVFWVLRHILQMDPISQIW